MAHNKWKPVIIIIIVVLAAAVVIVATTNNNCSALTEGITYHGHHN